MWRAEYNLWEAVFSLQHVGSWKRICFVRLGGMCLVFVTALLLWRDTMTKATRTKESIELGTYSQFPHSRCLVASRRAECWSSNWEILILISKQQAERERERLTDKHWTWDILKIKPRTKNSNVWAYRAHSYSNHHILLPAEPFYLFVNIILIINRLNSIIIMQSYFNISF